MAKFVGRHFEAELVGNANFKAGSYEQSLIDNYLKMDELLETAAGRREMRDLQSESGGDNGYEEGSYVADMKGCTATVVLIVDDYMYFANAGDTRAIVGKKGKAQQITNDHKPDLPTEKNRIIKAGGSVTEGRVEGNLNLSRALGDMQYKKDKTQKPEHHMITAYPEVSKLKITKDLDFLVIGCDGVWEEKTNQQILDFIYKKYEGGAKSPKLSEIVEPLLDSLVSPDYVQTCIQYIYIYLYIYIYIFIYIYSWDWMR